MNRNPTVDWHSIDTVLLDMDGTLLDLRYDTTFWIDYLPQRYAEHHDVAIDAAQALVAQLMVDARPRLDYYCFDWWSRMTGLDIVALKPDLAHLIRFRDGAEAFIAAIRRSGRRAVIVTNAHQEGVALKHRITGILDLVDAVECAHDHDHPKEHQTFWHRVHERIGFDSQRTLLVDDNLDVLASAERFGIAHLLAVARPDSGRPALADLTYPAVHEFSAITPQERPR